MHDRDRWRAKTPECRYRVAAVAGTEDSQSIFDRVMPRIGPLEAVRRHKLITVLPVIILVAGGIFYSTERKPVYEAEARQAIGRVDVSQPGALAGFQSATRALASSYSRAIVAPAVVNPVARRTGLSPDAVRSRLIATPIPESAIISLRATGPSRQEAIAVASAGANALEAYVARLNRSNPNADRLFREFRRASLRLSEREAELAEARRAAGGDPDRAAVRRLSTLRQRVADAQLTTRVAGENYTISRRSESNVSILQTISLPQSATDDRSSNFQLVMFVCVAGGVLLGIALASFVANRRVRRALTAH